ncbi:methyl-accepting chemotaxis protein [Celerinatantimonas yamalensis]|uniref:PAS domain-containing methyl-accepting chemotaxis protein n=1 Tax=Celerinatantimonas yamalensis TaxID=559956 RepID=A0ABW9G5Z8_9GAMM
MGRTSQTVIDEEVSFSDDEELVSTTDLRGVITYANDAFCRVAGYSYEELVGKNHNLVRHPDMPKAAFKDLWEKLKDGRHWRGAVKNRCKDGRYYWVDAFVTPIYENKQLVGYQSVRTQLLPEYRHQAETVYDKLNHNRSIEKWYEGAIFRHILFVLFSIGFLVAAAEHYLFAIGEIVLPFVVYFPELVTLPRYFRGLRERYDSPSRWVYCGNTVQSISEFHTLIYKGRLRTAIGRVLDSARPLHQASQTLLRTVGQAREAVSDQNQEMHQVSTAMEEMVQTIHDIADNTQNTTVQVDLVNQLCTDASEGMSKASTQIQALADEVSRSAEAADELTRETESISHIMQEIQGIADQTNLLALNAAIEAARAGDQGRGFAVVADEVRALSQRTHKATEQIEVSIQQMKHMVQSWTQKMRQSQSSATGCVSYTQDTDEAVRVVAERVRQISDLAAQISTAAEQQNVVAKEVNRNISNINQSAEINLAQIERVDQISNDVDERSDKLAALAMTFGD